MKVKEVPKNSYFKVGTSKFFLLEHKENHAIVHLIAEGWEYKGLETMNNEIECELTTFNSH